MAKWMVHAKIRPWKLAVTSSAVLTVLATALTGCGSSGSDNKGASASGGSSNAPATITLVTAGQYLTGAMLYVALEKGYFAQQNLTVKLTTTSSATTAISAISGNSAQIGLLGLNQGANSTVRGQAITAFAASNNQLPIQVVVSNKVWTDNNLENADLTTRIKALKGLNLGVVTATGQNALIFNSLFKSVGTTQSEAKAKYQVLGDPNTIVTAFNQGRIDGFDLNPFFPQQVVAAGQGHILVDIAAGQVPELGGMVNSGFVATPSYIASHADVLQRFTTAIAVAERWEKNNPTEAGTLLHDKYFQTTPMDQLQSTLNSLLAQGGLSPNPVIDPAGFESFINFSFSDPSAPKLNVAVTSLYTNQFATPAATEAAKLLP